MNDAHRSRPDLGLRCRVRDFGDASSWASCRRQMVLRRDSHASVGSVPTREPSRRRAGDRGQRDPRKQRGQETRVVVPRSLVIDPEHVAARDGASGQRASNSRDRRPRTTQRRHEHIADDESKDDGRPRRDHASSPAPREKDGQHQAEEQERSPDAEDRDPPEKDQRDRAHPVRPRLHGGPILASVPGPHRLGETAHPGLMAEPRVEPTSHTNVAGSAPQQLPQVDPLDPRVTVARPTAYGGC